MLVAPNGNPDNRPTRRQCLRKRKSAANCHSPKPSNVRSKVGAVSSRARSYPQGPWQGQAVSIVVSGAAHGGAVPLRGCPSRKRLAALYGGTFLSRRECIALRFAVQVRFLSVRRAERCGRPGFARFFQGRAYKLADKARGDLPARLRDQVFRQLAGGNIILRIYGKPCGAWCCISLSLVWLPV